MALDDVSVFTEWEKSRPYPWTEKNFSESLSSKNLSCFVWEENSERMGFAVVQLIETECYLQNFMTHPHYRRKGWGEKILQKVMMWARDHGATVFILDVDSTNTAAINLYKKLGFHLDSKRHKSYPRGEDAYIMRYSF